MMRTAGGPRRFREQRWLVDETIRTQTMTIRTQTIEFDQVIGGPPTSYPTRWVDEFARICPAPPP